jgi:hypothetical protein
MPCRREKLAGLVRPASMACRRLYFASNMLTLAQLREPDIDKRVSDDISRSASDCNDFCVWRL